MASRALPLARETFATMDGPLSAEAAAFAERLRKFGSDVEQLSADHRAAYAKFGIYSK